MKTAIIKRVFQAPNWNEIPKINVNEQMWLDANGIEMTAQICYTDKDLLLRLASNEKKLRAEHDSPLCEVCEDSCMEFFFSPCYDDARYFNIECNPNCCTYIGFNIGRENNARLTFDDEKKLFGFASDISETGWEITYHIPLSFIRLFFPDFSFRCGNKMRANFYKCGELSEHPHYLSWNRCTAAEPDFHRPCDFGTLIFE